MIKTKQWKLKRHQAKKRKHEVKRKEERTLMKKTLSQPQLERGITQEERRKIGETLWNNRKARIKAKVEKSISKVALQKMTEE